MKRILIIVSLVIVAIISLASFGIPGRNTELSNSEAEELKMKISGFEDKIENLEYKIDRLESKLEALDYSIYRSGQEILDKIEDVESAVKELK
ncbi:MAG: hypothetical protein LBV74_12980 [Tannerella sp.]|jgi:peptidoglycan hydrolase CwlO-like protein|nr:hypothetical protein [Tannerella sp.]